MIESVKFDYKKIIDKANKINKEIDFNSSNIKYLKKAPLGFIYAGLVIAAFMAVGVIPSVIVGDMELSTGIIVLLLSVIIVAIYGIAVVSGKMKVMSYNILKKIVKTGKYEIYEYKAEIQSAYQATKLNTRQNLDTDLSWTGVRENGNKIIVDNQTIYLDQKVYKQIMFDKQIILYFAKKDDLCILFDYARIENK